MFFTGTINREMIIEQNVVVVPFESVTLSQFLMLL